MWWGEERLVWTDEDAETLEQLRVDEDGPGTILRDFEMLLAFVQEHELPLSKANQLPPMKVLPELNARMTHPIELGLTRPQLRSYPHLAGLYLLLRATGLGCLRGGRAKPVLGLDGAAHEVWQGLAPTERYFTLLEAWLVRGDPEVLGDRDRPLRFIGRTVQDCAVLLGRTQGEGELASNDRLAWFVQYSPGLHGVALLELFGFLTVMRGPVRAGQGWQMERLTSTRLGLAVFALLSSELLDDFDRLLALEKSPPDSFGVLQPVFRPWVPAWRNNLSLPAWPLREGVHLFKVSLGRDLWRRLAVPGRLDLDTLAYAILDAYEFDYDHLYCFTYRDRFGGETSVYHPYMDEGPWTPEVRVGEVPLPEGQSMEYLYDFGDQWSFEVKLERVEPADPEMDEVVVLESRGEAPGDAPEQYGPWEEWE